MSGSKEVAERASNVPDLHPTPAFQITAEDIALPRMYVGQFMSKAVQNQLVKPGCIFSASGQDDPDPQVLWDGTGDGVLFHVVGMRKGKSISEGGELQLFDYDDPAAPADAWVTYGYTLVLPEVDTEVPFKYLLTRTGRPAAQAINTVLMKNSISHPAHENAFRLTAVARENAKGKYFVPRVAVVTADKKHVAAAANIASQMNAQPVEQHAAEQPAI